MLVPLPNLSNAGPLPLPEAAAPLRDSGSGGPDFSQLMQQQADRQAALRAVDQQVAASTRSGDAGSPLTTATAARSAGNGPGRPAGGEGERAHRPQPTATRSNTEPAPRSDAAKTEPDGPDPTSRPDAEPTAANRRETPPRARAAAGTAGGGTGRAAGPAHPTAGDASATDGALPDAAAGAAAATVGAGTARHTSTASTAQWARQRQATAGTATDLGWPSATGATATTAGADDDSQDPLAADVTSTGTVPGDPVNAIPWPGQAQLVAAAPPVASTAEQAAASTLAGTVAIPGVQVAVQPPATAMVADGTPSATTTATPATALPATALPAPSAADGAAQAAAGAGPVAGAPIPTAPSQASVRPVPATVVPALDAQTTARSGMAGEPTAAQAATPAQSTATVPAGAASAVGATRAALAASLAGAAVGRGSATDGSHRTAARQGPDTGTGVLPGPTTSPAAGVSRTALRQAAAASATPAEPPAAEVAVDDALATAPDAAAGAGLATDPPVAAPALQTGATSAAASLLAASAPAMAGTVQTGAAASSPRADDTVAAVRPAGAKAQAALPEPVTASPSGQNRAALPGDAPIADPARPMPDATGQAASPQPMPAQAGPASPPAAGIERAAQAIGATGQAATRAEPQAQADPAAGFQVLPPATPAVSAPATANPGAVAGAVPTEARVPVPLDSPGFGAALGTQVSVMVRDGVQTARLQLNPAEMGPIAVQIALDGSAARVDFQADLAGTRAVIEASLPALASALQEAGFTLAGGGVFQQAPGRQGQGDAPAQPGQHRGSDGTSATADLPAVTLPARTQRGLVDLVA